MQRSRRVLQGGNTDLYKFYAKERGGGYVDVCAHYRFVCDRGGKVEEDMK